MVEELGPQQSVWTGAYMDHHVTESIEWSKKNHQIEIIELSKEEKAKWDKLLEPLTENWVQDAKAKGLPAEAIVEDIRQFGNMYAGQ